MLKNRPLFTYERYFYKLFIKNTLAILFSFYAVYILFDLMTHLKLLSDSSFSLPPGCTTT